jgi:hypothetical protein
MPRGRVVLKRWDEMKEMLYRMRRVWDMGIGVEGHGREIPTQHSISQSL